MTVWNRLYRTIQGVLLLCLVAAVAPAQAHLMVAQKGTLNFSGDGAYLVLSLPVSAFEGVDNDGDQLLSSAELRLNAGRIEQQIRAGAQLLRDGQPLELQGLMLNLSPSDDAPTAPANQIVALGRYALASADLQADAQTAASGLDFKLNLFGRTRTEQVFDITFTRKPQAQIARYSQEHDTHVVLPAPYRVFIDQLRSGGAHVLGGADHLLFLLVVLASMAGARRGWRQAVLTLTCFTAGHALTLAASAVGGVAISPSLVEPAIAATIVGMALFDLWQRHRARWASPSLNLVLVFACALIHGLGLVGALGAATLSSANLMWSLAGFNLGIELAQVGLATVASGGVIILERWTGEATASQAAVTASTLGVVLGGGWLIERALPLV